MVCVFKTLNLLEIIMIPYKHIFPAFLLFVFSLSSYAQDFILPLDIPPLLSADFGDLRSNHFHSGLDFKTQSVENKPVFAVSDGYVSRVNISPGGYGLALYITHPNGYTTVYGHLNRFSKKIADYAKQKQYEQESFRVDIYLKPNEIPVKKGERVALSGNTGGSGGPHLHFEFRDTKTEEVIDPLDFFAKQITDTRRPEVQGISFYPMAGQGVINQSASPLRLPLTQTKSGTPSALARTVQAWGQIGLGVKAFDRMNGTANTYGVKYVRLFVDGKRVFSSTMDRFSFDKTRMLNAFTDFDEYRTNKSFYMRSFVEPGNTLPFYETVNNGVININEERVYNFRYELQDNAGNQTEYSFSIKGVKQAIPPLPACDNYKNWAVKNLYVTADFTLNIMPGNLYEDLCYIHKTIISQKYHSNIQQVNDKIVPLHKNGTIWLKIKNVNPANVIQYGIISIDRRGKEEWVGGKYRDGGVEASIRELGAMYAVDLDTVAPVIMPINPTQWTQRGRIVIQLTDDKSGIAFARGEIDGKFALFTNDVKSKNYIYEFDDARLAKGQNHTLVFTATDGAGNKSVYNYQFMY